ncbi:hypothetical protein B0T25DRAFT_533513 [Lasiosphaeria hispida]|uniref:FAD-binding domain-containing protein n=1 Tax=Lasiosphaeria hispida TaxID=260671 RepID=A0AAJ0HR52_9PEZI|nr:hypothetical protein B0T25DRAFT_533513 [Lasiosphaeria hispida]
MSRPMKVLISGAGVAGNALAFWLAKLGYCDVTVIESFPSLRTTGQQVDLRGAGIGAIRRMGLEEAFRAKAVPEEGMRFVDKSGKSRAFFPANKTGKGPQSFTSEFEIMRGDLCQLMYDATAKDHTKYVFGTRIDNFEENQDGTVNVGFSDGTTDQFDLVVGADGVGSRTRKLMLGCHGSSAKDPSFHPKGNSYIAYFSIPRPQEDGEGLIANIYLAPGNRMILTRRHTPQDMQVLFVCWQSSSERLRTARRGDVKAEKEAIDDAFRGAGWQVDELLDAMKDTPDSEFYCQRQGLVKMEYWSKGHVVLLGDAGYCPSVNGFGTSAAVMGAYILAGEIATHCGKSGSESEAVNVKGLGDALKAYEQKFRPFMDKMQKGEESDRNWMPSSSFSVAAMNYLVGAFAFLKLHILVMRFWNPEKGLDLPDYGDVLRV